jgi:hypothetical protein
MYFLLFPAHLFSASTVCIFSYDCMSCSSLSPAVFYKYLIWIPCAWSFLPANWQWDGFFSFWHLMSIHEFRSTLLDVLILSNSSFRPNSSQFIWFWFFDVMVFRCKNWSRQLSQVRIIGGGKLYYFVDCRRAGYILMQRVQSYFHRISIYNTMQHIMKASTIRSGWHSYSSHVCGSYRISYVVSSFHCNHKLLKTPFDQRFFDSNVS